MDFENRLKRELSQGVLKCLLEDCGYHVIPLGIEAVIREIACLDKEAYKNLDFSDAVRFLPDFCILDQNLKHKLIVEVKYRWDWDGNILKEVSNQVRMFRDIILEGGNMEGVGSNLQNSIDDDFKRNTISAWQSKDRVENVFYNITSRG